MVPMHGLGVADIIMIWTAIENAFACMKAGYDAGINFFDCAEGYAGEKNGTPGVVTDARSE